MSDIQVELKQLKDLLALEKAADLEQHRKIIQTLPLEERVAKGYAWFPVQAIKSGYSIGERAFVTVEWSKKEQAHHFRPGKTVNLFTQQAGAHQPEKTGVIQFVDKGRMKIVLNSKDLPDWLGLGQIGVDLLFDDRTYQEMEKALQRVTEARGDRLAELRDILLGKYPPRFAETGGLQDLAELNPAQNQAVRQIINAHDVTVVHGPPGTGKTTTLVQAVRMLAQTEATVLVTAPSNTAVDLITEKLAEQGLEVVRIGNISRVDEHIIRHTLDAKLSTHPESKNIKKVKQQAAEARRKAKRYKRKFGREEYQARRQLFQEAKELSAWALQLEDRLIQQLLDGAQAITSTLVGAAHPVLDRRKFRTVIIDEAAQALEPACWIPITRASRVVLAGDPFQLPPTVKSNEAQRAGLGITLIEKALQRISQTQLLNIQYRMHEQIMGFSNQQFYGGALRAAAQVRHHTLSIEGDAPLVFIDTAGCGFEEKVEPKYHSRYNPDEFQILTEHLYQLLDKLGNTPPTPAMAIISPYREQVLFMKTQIDKDLRLAEAPISINTIDGFQGQERDVVYLSLVRSNEKGEIGFLKDYRRMNVAMTRARKKLIVIGDSATIGGDEFYRAFLEYCETHGSYQTAWEYMQ